MLHFFSQGLPALRPSLYLPFALTKTLDPRITFTRNSSGSFTDSSLVLQNAASHVPRFTHDPASGESLGFMPEDQRQNLLTGSVTQSIAVSAIPHTISFYGTGTVTLSGASTAGPLVGTGANNRVTLTFTPAAGTLTLTVSGTVDYLQCEPGATATSYIFNPTSTATRAADVASITGNNFTSWYRPDEWTFVISFQTSENVATVATFSIGTTTANRIEFHAVSSTDLRVTCRTGNVEQAALQGSRKTGRNTIAVSAKTDNLAASFNGGTIVADTSAALAAYDTLWIGRRSDGGIYLNGTIESIKYYPVRLSNTQLQRLSA